eukprot:4614077-Prymnesium_polylepis.1
MPGPFGERGAEFPPHDNRVPFVVAVHAVYTTFHVEHVRLHVFGRGIPSVLDDIAIGGDAHHVEVRYLGSAPLTERLYGLHALSVAAVSHSHQIDHVVRFRCTQKRALEHLSV